MKRFLQSIGIILVALLLTFGVAHAATILFPSGGGTGWGTPGGIQAHTVVLGNNLNPVSTTSPSTSGFVLTSNGVNADPTFQAITSGAAYPFPLTGNATSTKTQFNGGLTAFASSTIGAGGQTTGLTINGGATTTGSFVVGSPTRTNFIVDNTGNVAVNSTSPSGLFSINATADAVGANPILFVGSSTNLSNPAFVVDNNGKVGIGGLPVDYSSPSLSVTSQGNTIVKISSAGLGGQVQLAFAGSFAQFINGTGPFFITNDSASAIIFRTSDTEYMRLDSSGNIGIGTSTPKSQLGVSTASQQSGLLPVFTVASTTNASLLTVLGNGNVGIGTPTPSSKFQVTAGASATTTSNFGEVGVSSSKACFNTKNTVGSDISFYFVGTAMVVENNLCK